MNTMFSFRLSAETSQLLSKLAEEQFRSRGGVLRWLIHYATSHQDLFPPESEILPQNTNNSDDGKPGEDISLEGVQ